jgi:pyridoxine 4-dehydrogenase
MNQIGRLGDKPIKRVGFGAMQLAGKGVFGPPADPHGARAVLRRALELGVDHIDTSQFYGPNVVNELIHEALHPYPEDLKLVSKVGARRDEKGGWLAAQTPQELRRGVEENLRTLEVERLAAVNLRRHHEGDVPLAEQLETMEELRQEGKIDLIGISNVSLEEVREGVASVPVACVQNAYSVLDRQDDPLVDFCAEQRIAYVPFFPLGSAFTGGPAKLAADPALQAVATRHDVKPTQVALAWLLHRSERILLIPGTSSLEHLHENMAAAELTLSAEDLAELEGVTQLGRPIPG